MFLSFLFKSDKFSGFFLTLQDKHNIRTLSLNIKFVRTRCETGLKSSFLKLVQINFIFTDNVRILYIYKGTKQRKCKSIMFRHFFFSRIDRFVLDEMNLISYTKCIRIDIFMQFRIGICFYYMVNVRLKIMTDTNYFLIK